MDIFMGRNFLLMKFMIGEFCIMLYDYDVVDDDELIFKVSDCIEILFWDFEVSGDDGWWVGCVEG